MKAAAIMAFATLALFFVNPAAATSPSDDPCGSKDSNRDMRECYAKEQTRVNAETDSLAGDITTELRKDVKEYESSHDSVVADLLRKAAAAVTQSQKTWKAYRDLHCSAVEYSWTTGSGAGTAYEAFMFALGQARLRELRTSFPVSN
jgi:uncharacterized protein YecT (DUF1311 family)